MNHMEEESCEVVDFERGEIEAVGGVFCTNPNTRVWLVLGWLICIVAHSSGVSREDTTIGWVRKARNS